MSIVAKVFVGLVVLVVLVVGGAAIAVSTIDINQYRGQIADALSKQTGRTVKFGGPIHLTFSMHGVGLAVEDASIGNPSWASRPQMAGIGKLQIGVELMPLMSHQIVISELDISNADILLETNANDQHNWDMKPAAAATETTEPKTTVAQPKTSTQSAAPIMPRINELSVVNSQLAMRDKTGKTSTFKVEKLTLAPSDHGTAITVAADFNGTPIKLTFKSTSPDLIAETNWPYTADLTYANYHLNAQGRVNVRNKSLEMNPYQLSAGGSALHGQLTADMSGAKADVHGSIMGDKLDPADFKPASSEAEAAKPEATPAAEPAATPSKPLFSTTPLDLSALNSASANLDVNIGEVVVANGSLKQVSGKLALANGNLAIAPFKASLGESAMTGDIKLEASKPPQYSLNFKAPGVDIATLLEMMGTKPFMTGKGDADIQLSGSGASLHDMASDTNGKIEVLADGGTISAASAGGIAQGLGEIFAPGSGNPTLNCVAVRFAVTGGVAKDNGILADSSASTVAGSGGFNLRDETVGMTLTAKPKVVSTAGITPAIKISGPLMSPGIGLDTASVAQNVAGVLAKNGSNKIAGALGGLLGGGGDATSGGVPAIATAPQGQNACLYTLDHKGAATASSTPAQQGNNGVKDVAGQATTKAKDAGKQLLQGLFGH